MVITHFENIRQQILTELDEAKNEIVAAVYWFTNEELFNKLLYKLDKGIDVQLIIHNDFINNRETGLAFQKFINKGGEFFFSSNDNPMHNKFCVIDKQILINGSYNWTYYAENKNRENILTIKNEKETIEKFLTEFERLKELSESITDIKQLTQFEVDENNILSARDYLANDIVFQAKNTNNKELVNFAFEIAPNNVDVQITASKLSLTKKYVLKHTIGASLADDGFKAIINKGASIPATFTSIVRTSKDNQTSTTSTICYGQSLKASENTRIVKMRLDGIPPKPQGEAEIKYFFTVDIKGYVRMEKFSLDNGKRQILNMNILHLLEEVN
jgi:hypothetical protein